MRLSRGQMWAAAILVASVVGGAASATDPIPDARMGVPTAPLLLLSRPEVRADLGLTTDQAAAASREIDLLHARAMEIRGKTTVDVVQARRSIDDSQQRWLTEHLSPPQAVRLAQIELQWEGPAALLRRRLVAEDLGLTAPQREALGVAIARREADRARSRDQAADDATLAATALAILSPEQKARWHDMLGHPCAFRARRDVAPSARPAG